MLSAAEALEQLKEGNRRYVSYQNSDGELTEQSRPGKLVTTQAPFAIILGCSDARVPAEIVFDQGLGDLFVIRVAGNIVAPSQVGSVEFCAAHFGAKLVIVLGHTQCGAIFQTLKELEHPTENRSSNLGFIIDRIKPSVETLLEADPRLDSEMLIKLGGRANIRSSANHLRHGSPVLEELIKNEGLFVVGAEYSIETGIVEFFDEIPVP
jgi:carbonic anhydrase